MNRQVIFDGSALAVVPAPSLSRGPDEVRIALSLAGICSTDLAITRGYFGYEGVLGHEFVGTVVEGPADWLGLRVVGEINIGCGACVDCAGGDSRHCLKRETLGIFGGYGGAFADELRLPICNLHRVPDTIADEAAVFAEPLAAAAEILEQIAINPSDRVVVVGIGRLGALCAQVLKQTGADVVGVVRRERQANLLQQWGIAAALRDDLADLTADVVVECTGSPEGLNSAIDLVRPCGTLVLKSTYEGNAKVNMSKVVVNEVTMVGSRCGPFDVALKMLQNQQVDVVSLIEQTYSLDDAVAAFAHAACPGVYKILLKP